MKLGLLVAAKKFIQYPEDSLLWTMWGPPLKMKNSKIELRHVLNWPKLDLRQNIMMLGLLVASENADKQTDTQDS